MLRVLLSMSEAIEEFDLPQGVQKSPKPRRFRPAYYLGKILKVHIMHLPIIRKESLAHIFNGDLKDTKKC